MATTRAFLRDLWALTRPYWFSEERWAARGLLAAVVALNLGIVYINVLLNKWQNDFYNALQDKDMSAFYALIWQFSLLAARLHRVRGLPALPQPDAADPLAALAHRPLSRATGSAAAPTTACSSPTAAPTTRTSASPRTSRCSWTSTLSLTLGLLSAVVTLVSFVAILWSLSGTLEFALAGTPVSIPGYMVWVALVYAIVGTWLTHLRRPAAHRPQFQPAAVRGQLPLLPGALPREHREHRDLRRRGRRDARTARAASRTSWATGGRSCAGRRSSPGSAPATARSRSSFRTWWRRRAISRARSSWAA